MDFLDELHRAEIGPIVWVQEGPGWLHPLMWLAALVGQDATVLILLATLYWCLDPRLGMRVALAVVLSSGVNAVAKLAFHEPRPGWIDSRVRALSGEGSFGLPSGHAQTSVVALGLLARAARAPAAWWAALAGVALICLSRVYLGVHFLSDVVVGALLGLVVLLAYAAFAGRVAAWWRGRHLAVQVALSAAVAGTLLGAGVAATAFWEGWTVPPGWRAAGADDPASLTRVVAMSGALFGGLAGASVIERVGWFSAAGGMGVRAVRWLLGVAGAVAIWQVAGLLGDTIPAGAVRYALVALWVVLGAPMAFVRLGLAAREDPARARA